MQHRNPNRRSKRVRGFSPSPADCCVDGSVVVASTNTREKEVDEHEPSTKSIGNNLVNTSNILPHFTQPTQASEHHASANETIKHLEGSGTGYDGEDEDEDEDDSIDVETNESNSNCHEQLGNHNSLLDSRDDGEIEVKEVRTGEIEVIEVRNMMELPHNRQHCPTCTFIEDVSTF